MEWWTGAGWAVFILKGNKKTAGNFALLFRSNFAVYIRLGHKETATNFKLQSAEQGHSFTTLLNK